MAFVMGPWVPIQPRAIDDLLALPDNFARWWHMPQFAPADDADDDDDDDDE